MTGTRLALIAALAAGLSAQTAPVNGTVMVEGGGPPTRDVTVQGYCAGGPGRSVITRSRFFLTVGEPRPGDLAGGREPACEVRATAAGYETAVVSLGPLQASGHHITIVLRPSAKSGAPGANTLSATSAMAPRDAQKALEKGLANLSKGKLADARKDLENAVRIYPAYAEAWFQLGTIHHREGRLEEAKSAYRSSLQADGKFLKPMVQLALISTGERKWSEALDLATQVLRQNPLEFPQAWLCTAIAQYNLGRKDEAEKAAFRVLDLDAPHRLPKALQLLGVILEERGEHSAAAKYLRAYVRYAPKAPDAAQAEQKATELERRATAPPPAP